MIDPLQIASVGTAVQADAGGVGFVPDQNIKPVWGVITGLSPFEDAPNNYTWEEVRFDDNWEWAPVQGSLSAGTYGSEWSGEHLLSPAREANGGSVEVGAIVYLIPSRPIGDVGGFSHRVWFFSNPTTNLRPFVLVEDLIPTGGGELDSSVKAEWLDLPFSIAPRSIEELSVTLYPAHKGEVDNPDAFFALGIGRGPSTYFRGTYGWATFNPVGRTEMKNGKAESVGEWQVVTLYAETIAQVVIEGGENHTDDPILPGQNGKGALLWFDKDKDVEEIIASGYQLDIHNDLFVGMQAGHIYKVAFNRNRYVWTPITDPPANGLTLHHSGSGVATVNEGELVQVPFDTDVIGDGDVEKVKAHYGLYLGLDAENNGIKNVGELPLVGRISWQVTAERVMTVADTNVNSWLEIVLKNNGKEVTGLYSRMTSSRRNVAATPPTLASQGAGAVNSNSGSVVQLLAPGDTLTVWIRKGSVGVGPNDWITLPGKCHITFTTEPNVVLEPIEP